MADEKKPVKTVEVELLADGIRMPDEDGVYRDYSRGDVITLPEEHADRLRKFGSVGDKGSVEKARKAGEDRDAAEAKRQRFLQGLPDPDEQKDNEPKPAPKPDVRPSPAK